MSTRHVRFARFVAVGDSQTEGLGDEPHADGTACGWADRFAARLAQQQGGLLYANLAVRGRRTRQVREDQLPAALALEPDLASAIAGVNDIIRPRFDLADTLADLDVIHRELTNSGALVISATIPDLSPVSPVARLVRSRLHQFNDGLRTIAERHSGILVDLAHWHETPDPRLWCEDRLHLSPLGHAQLAEAVSARLCDGSSNARSSPTATAATPPPARRLDRELAWAVRYVGPWILRRLTGRSSGDGRVAKHIRLIQIEP
jgi:lysophospholipase L1-like esterase